MKVAIIMGSMSDWEYLKDAYNTLKDFGVECEVRVVSAHRTPDSMYDFAKNARQRGIQVIIAGAGGAAHLPGMVASMTTLPVVGVPIPTKHLGGLDSLYSIVQMPAGIPVATVAIGNSTNAALLALRILSLKYDNIKEKLDDYMQSLREKVDLMNQKLLQEL